MSAPIALSCGEPAGIGPEIAQAAWVELRQSCPFFWIGDPQHLPSDAVYDLITTPNQALSVSAAAMPVLAHPFPKQVRAGHLDPENASAVVDVLSRAIALVQSGDACALCTAPIHKKNLMDGAGFACPGHTEFLAAKAGVAHVVMMLAGPELRVVPATIHIPLHKVASALTPDLLRQTIEITAQGLKSQFGIAAPRLVVAGLNPHAGEGGALGREEGDWIEDLVAEVAAATGLDVTGPWPGDTLFHTAARARYDAAICMYHDQALIPIKTLDFDRGVNVTLGLPFIRTSPDHGTALDIAGRGLANPTSLIEALKLAQNMSQKQST